MNNNAAADAVVSLRLMGDLRRIVSEIPVPQSPSPAALPSIRYCYDDPIPRRHGSSNFWNDPRTINLIAVGLSLCILAKSVSTTTTATTKTEPENSAVRNGSGGEHATISSRAATAANNFAILRRLVKGCKERIIRQSPAEPAAVSEEVPDVTLLIRESETFDSLLELSGKDSPPTLTALIRSDTVEQPTLTALVRENDAGKADQCQAIPRCSSNPLAASSLPADAQKLVAVLRDDDALTKEDDKSSMRRHAPTKGKEGAICDRIQDEEEVQFAAIQYERWKKAVIIMDFSDHSMDSSAYSFEDEDDIFDYYYNSDDDLEEIPEEDDEEVVTQHATTTTSSDDANCKMTTRVRFSFVHVQEYATTLGDHPHTTEYPLCLDWCHAPARQFRLAQYESIATSLRKLRRRRRARAVAGASARTRSLTKAERRHRLYEFAHHNNENDDGYLAEALAQHEEALGHHDDDSDDASDSYSDLTDLMLYDDFNF